MGQSCCKINCVVIGVLFLLSSAAEAQQPAATFQNAAQDPIVVQLLGRDTLDQIQDDFLRQAATLKDGKVLSDRLELVQSLDAEIALAAEVFTNQKWESTADEFEPGKFLSAFEKLRAISEQNGDDITQQAVKASLERLVYKLDRQPIQFWMEWDFKKTGTEELAKQIIKREFFVVPVVCWNRLSQESQKNYQKTFALIARKAGRKDRTQLLDNFTSNTKNARAEAKAWFVEHRKSFGNQLGSELEQFQIEFFRSNVQGRIYTAGRRELVKLASLAKSELNNVASGSRQVRSQSGKCIDRAKQGDIRSAQSYLNDALSGGAKVAESNAKLIEIVRGAEIMRWYLIDEAGLRSNRSDIGRLSVEELKVALQQQPRGGNQNSVARNTLSEMIRVGEKIEQLQEWKLSATKNFEQIRDDLAAAEDAINRLTSAQGELVQSPFDVSSREAFEASKQKLSQVLPTDQYVALTQAWVKLLQAAIKEDPMVMADDKKYLAFLKKHFEGKSVDDILGK